VGIRWNVENKQVLIRLRPRLPSQVCPLKNRSMSGGASSGNLRLLLNYFTKGTDTIAYPLVDTGLVTQRAADTGAGTCTVVIVAAMDLPVQVWRVPAPACVGVTLFSSDSCR